MTLLYKDITDQYTTIVYLIKCHLRGKIISRFKTKQVYIVLHKTIDKNKNNELLTSASSWPALYRAKYFQNFWIQTFRYLFYLIVYVKCMYNDALLLINYLLLQAKVNTSLKHADITISLIQTNI